MEAIREYLLGVSAAALVCGIATKLIRKGMIGSVVKLMAGVFVALAVAAPLVEIRLDALSDLTLDAQTDAAQVAADGENSARQAMAQIISQKSAAYILDKAEALGASLTVEVTVSADGYPVPCSVELAGRVSPYAKSVLAAYISDQLGIDTEEQTWIT